eukprot:scaffold100793_cov51-Attheya_sp.AAC.1
MVSTYDLFSTNFINLVITPIASQNEEPNYASIRVAHTQLHDNAAAIFSPAGGGCHGHLALTMTDVKYFAITNVAFTVAINPTGDPVMVRSSRLESSENLCKHEEAKKAFKLYHDVDKALRKQLIAATPEVYLQDLRDPILGYANITCLAIITHLRYTYGEILQEALDMSTTRMGVAWNPPTPIEDLFEQLRAGAAFATEGVDAPSKPAMVRLGPAKNGGTNLKRTAPWSNSRSTSSIGRRIVGSCSPPAQQAITEPTMSNLHLYQPSMHHHSTKRVNYEPNSGKSKSP